MLAGCKIKNGHEKTTRQPLSGNFKGYFEYKGKKLNTLVNFDFKNGKQVWRKEGVAEEKEIADLIR